MTKGAIPILSFAAAVGGCWAWLVTPRAASPNTSLNFTQQVLRVGKGPGFVAIADVNHDGNPDLLVANEEDGTISVVLGDGNGHFAPAVSSPFPCNPNPNDIAVADMNGDGNPDLVIANHQTPYITVLLGDGKGGFTTMRGSPLSLAGCDGPNRIAAGDLTGNGRRDIVVSCALNNEVFLFLAGKDGSFNTSSHSVPTGWGGLAVGRLQAGARDAIVVSNHNSTTITVLLSK